MSPALVLYKAASMFICSTSPLYSRLGGSAAEAALATPARHRKGVNVLSLTTEGGHKRCTSLKLCFVSKMLTFIDFL